jgi:hypothetical protein
VPRRRPVWPWFAVAAALGLVAGIIVVVNVAVGTGGDAAEGTLSGVSATTEPISRAEVLAQYAEISPLDSSATPENVDTLATLICERLDTGTSTDTVITDATDTWNANATEVVRLLVSYRCPEHLGEFK